MTPYICMTALLLAALAWSLIALSGRISRYQARYEEETRQ